MKTYFKLKMVGILVLLNSCQSLKDDASDFAERCGTDFILLTSQCGTDNPFRSSAACLLILNDYSKNCL
ncbi:Uncharacterized protein XB16_2614 [Leptospira santarosai]|uniref:Uncharacterized protein n=1 Tax=Leptospira santarosai TaxID=28183 RepID=A0A2P1QVI5_9LEPT|nr:Uncharacterized protein XB16_2614 [Leptospira santarosai]AVV50386.1 Uncharacterized protein XB17_01798 [Leptospira santarosai]